MPAGKLNLTIEQGATYKKSLTWKDDTGAAINLTGYHAKMRIVAHALTILDLSDANGMISLASDGSVNIMIPAATTDTMVFTAGSYDLKLIAPNGDEIRLVEGNVYISLSVTPR